MAAAPAEPVLVERARQTIAASDTIGFPRPWWAVFVAQAYDAGLAAGGALPLHVVQAALFVDGAVITKPRPARHGDLFRHAVAHASPEGQGFLLSDGSYATRERAWEVAVAAGQPILRLPEVRCGEYLFSEDLW